MAAELKVKVEDFDWPVLFTSKKGDQALCMCSNPAKHGGMNDAKHKPPANFDREALTQKFATKATEAQMKGAQWTPSKKI